MRLRYRYGDVVVAGRQEGHAARRADALHAVAAVLGVLVGGGEEVGGHPEPVALETVHGDVFLLVPGGKGGRVGIRLDLVEVDSKAGVSCFSKGSTKFRLN